MDSFRKTLLAVFFLICISSLLGQDEIESITEDSEDMPSSAETLSVQEAQRSSIPDELLRPQRDESERFPIDVLIGEIGQGLAPREAYENAKLAASELMAGNTEAVVFANVNKAFIDIEESINALNEINPLSFRLGGGHIMPDGSVSFLIRFIGREMGITGELFIKFEERRIEIPPVITEPEIIDEIEDSEDEETTEEVIVAAAAPTYRYESRWFFEEIILEEPRSRETENADEKRRFDFYPYERVF